MREPVTAACVQVEPAILDRAGTIDRVAERTAEAAAAGAALVVFPETFVPAYPSSAWAKALETPLGRIGGLICWENYMPLARFSLYESGIEIYIASTADDGDAWQATLRHIALESRAFVVAPSHFQRASAYPDDFPLRDLLEGLDVIGRGGSAILAPDGSYLA